MLLFPLYVYSLVDPVDVLTCLRNWLGRGLHVCKKGC